MVMNIGYIMIHQWELGDHNSLKQDTHGCGGIFGGLRNLNHLRKLFDLEPVANTWQAYRGMVKMRGVIYVFSGHCC